jgi:hypothetical protein
MMACVSLALLLNMVPSNVFADGGSANTPPMRLRHGKTWPTKEMAKTPVQRNDIANTVGVARALSEGDCLCVFDIDRTLTGAQGKVSDCPRNKLISSIEDNANGGGRLTLSALAAEGINTTFCGSCYLGICSAGNAGGEGSAERTYLVEHVLRSLLQNALVDTVQSATSWSHHDHVESPLVVGSPDKEKQVAVERIRQWYGKHNITIASDSVYFFGDRTENMEPFAEYGFNAKEISCGSRDEYLYHGTNMVGYCGATPEEIVTASGISRCVPQCQDEEAWNNGFRWCVDEGYGVEDGCIPGKGWSCLGYEKRGWCKGGSKQSGFDFAFGAQFNFPEKNCCVCGGGSVGSDMCRPTEIRRRRRGGGSSRCSCRRRSSAASEDLPSGWECRGNYIQKK